jgi:phytoene/squalene synthetase
VYFPAADLARHGLTPEDILSCRYDGKFRALMHEYSQKAHGYFASGRRLLQLLDLRSRMCVNVMQGVYAELLKRIEHRDYDVMTDRVSLSTREKLTLIGRLWGQAALVRRK